MGAASSSPMSGPDLLIHPAGGDLDMDRIRALLREYAAAPGIDLCFQNFDHELASLPGRYSPPYGALLIAMSGEEAAGCVALRQLENEICEMKRLFVRSNFRGSGLGRRLALAIIDAARERGYKRIRLDTLPVQQEAHRLYESLGFYDIGPYYNSSIAESRFMEMML